MLKTYLFFTCCFIAVCCFSQSVDKDTAAKAITLQKLTKDTGLLNINKTSLKIYPNPARNRISIDVKGFEPGMAVVKIIDTKGKIWRVDNRLLIDGNEEIPMFFQLNPGIYFISVIEKAKISKKKLIIL